MATTRYATVAWEQQFLANFPGGGVTNQGPTGAPFNAPNGFNDPGVEIGIVREVIAIYQMYGNESVSDVINICLAQPGTMLDPARSSVCQVSPATTATLNIGDDDVKGYGLLTNPTGDPTKTPLGANPTRYASAINVATGQTNPIAMTGGASLADPYQIGALAVEPVNTQTGVGTAGPGMAGSWIQGVFVSLGTPVAGGALVFRLYFIKP